MHFICGKLLHAAADAGASGTSPSRVLGGLGVLDVRCGGGNLSKVSMCMLKHIWLADTSTCPVESCTSQCNMLAVDTSKQNITSDTMLPHSTTSITTLFVPYVTLLQKSILQ
jgi:2-polyprenyl-3-methyl-5-hydroxy-6-metoxy-1,4-benzoquinol methylase